VDTVRYDVLVSDGQVRSYYYWQLASRSVRLGLEPLIVTHVHVLGWKKISILSFVRRSPCRVDRAAMCRDLSLCLCCVCVYPIFILSLLLILMLLCTKVCVHVRPVSPGTAQQIMPTVYTYSSSDTWTIVCLTTTKFEPFMFPVLGFVFGCFRHLHYREFVWLLFDSHIFLLCNHRRTESGTPDVKRESVCALVGYQWCAGLYFAGAAILTDVCPPQTPMRGRRKSFCTSLRLYKGLLSTWRLIVHFSKVSRFWWMFEGPWWRSNLCAVSMWLYYQKLHRDISPLLQRECSVLSM